MFGSNGDLILWEDGVVMLARIENCTVQVLRSLSYPVFLFDWFVFSGVGSKHLGVVRIGYTHSPVNGEGSEYFFIP